MTGGRISIRWLAAVLICTCGRSISAQCGAVEAVDQVERRGCLSPAAAASLRSWLGKPAEDGRAEASALAGEAYECLLQKKVPHSDFSCFAFTLRVRVYDGRSSAGACIRERLTAALLSLRDIEARAGSAKAEPDMQVLDSALGDFLGAYSAARAVRENPKLATSIKLAAFWCLDINDPSPAPAFAEEFVDAMARIAAVFPDQGRHLGAVLGTVLRDARRPDAGDPAASRLNDLYRRLIEPDQQSIAGTSHFYILHSLLEEMVPSWEVAGPAKTTALLKISKELQQRLETGVQRLQIRVSAWQPFEEYSDLLNGLARRLGPASNQEAWHELSRLACDLLREGLEVSVGTEEAVRLPLQNKLLDRIAAYGSELARMGRFRLVVEFESRFLNSSARVLTPAQQCYIHAHLAQAYYALNDHRNAMEHLAAANSSERGELITPEDLKRLK